MQGCGGNFYAKATAVEIVPDFLRNNCANATYRGVE